MFSKSSKYAVRSVLFLVSKKNNKVCGSKEIAEKLNIPAPFLAKTMQELARKKVISSIKGPNGGFFLTKKDVQNSILDVITAIDVLDKFNNCFLGHHECNDLNPCIVHHIYSPFKTELLNILKTKTILDFASEINKNPDKVFYKIINS